jgi:hypothetical protein
MAISQAIAPVAEPNAHSSGFIRMLYRPWLDRAIAAIAVSR